MSTTQATYRIGTYYGETETRHIWEITDEQGIAAELYVAMDTLTVVNIETREDRRGEGLARALWEAATECHVTYCTCSDDCDDDSPYGY